MVKIVNSMFIFNYSVSLR